MNQETVLSKIRQLILLKGQQDSFNKNIENNNQVIETLQNASKKHELTERDYTRILDKYSLNPIIEARDGVKNTNTIAYCYCGVKVLVEKTYHNKHYQICDNLIKFNEQQLKKLIKEKYVYNSKLLDEQNEKLIVLKLTKETLKNEEQSLQKKLNNTSLFRFFKKKRLTDALESKKIKLLGIAKEIDVLEKKIREIENKTDEDVWQEAKALQSLVAKIYDHQNSKDNLDNKIQELNKENDKLEFDKKESIKKAQKILVEIISNKEHIEILKELYSSMSMKSQERIIIHEILENRKKGKVVNLFRLHK